MSCFSLVCVFFPFSLSALASILRAWLDQCPEDFQEPPSFPSLHRVLGFLQKAMPGSEPMRRAQSLLEQLQVQASLENESDGRSSSVTVNLHHLCLYFCSCLFSVFLCLQKHLMLDCHRRLPRQQSFLPGGRRGSGD